MEKRELNEALKSLAEIKALLREKTQNTLKKIKLQFLIWGLYQIVASVVVYYTHNWLYFLLLLPVFFFLSLIQIPKVFLSFVYWTASLLLYVLLIKYVSFTAFYIFFILSIFFGFWILSPKRTGKERLSGLFWLNTIAFALLFQMAIFHVKAYPLLYFSWSGIILFALGAIGVFGEISLLIIALLGNTAGAFFFSYAPDNYKIFTMVVYGLFYMLYFLYLSIKLKNSHG